MSVSFENDHTEQFAIGEDDRDLRAGTDALKGLDTPVDPDARRELAKPADKLEAFKPGLTDDRPNAPDLFNDLRQQNGPSGRGPWYRRVNKRVLLITLLLMAVAAITPFAWNYLQSYESTDDAQIDGHIDPLSSRIDGTVIGVHAEDDDQVTKGQFLVEIDPRDYEVAIEQARARLELA